MIKFQKGDIVTRDGTDLQKILEIDDDLMLVECVRAPLGWLNDDGTRGEPWCKVGEQEWNLPRRYSYPEQLTIEMKPVPSGETIDALADLRRRAYAQAAALLGVTYEQLSADYRQMEKSK